MTDPFHPQRMTVKMSFRFEEESPIRHEFHAGDVFAVSSATAQHNTLAGSVFAAAVRSVLLWTLSSVHERHASPRSRATGTTTGVVVVCAPNGRSRPRGRRIRAWSSR